MYAQSPRDLIQRQLAQQLARKTALAVSPGAAPPTTPPLGEFVSFDVPGSGSAGGQGTMPVSINLFGTVTGNYMDAANALHGFIRASNGITVSFDPPGSKGTFPVAINDLGVVTGYYNDAAGNSHGFVRRSDCSASHPNGCTIVAFDVPGSIISTNPTDINFEGQIDGYYSDANGVHGFLRQPSGTIATFDAPGGAPAFTYAASLNLEGLITGFDGANVGFVRSFDGAIQTFAPSNATLTLPASINVEGSITGYYLEPYANADGFTLRGFVRTKAGAFQTFDAATYSPCCIFTYPVGINDFGAIAGYDNDGYGVFHGFLREANGTIKTFDAPSAGTAYMQGTKPQAINLAGAIAGSYVDSNNVNHGFIFLPW